MKVITKNNVSARGKQNVLLLAEKQDKVIYSDTIASEILSLVNCAIFIEEPEEEVDIRRFVACILIVSSNLIKNKNEIHMIYNSMIANQIPIIPISVQPGIKNEFSKEFGKLQCIARENDDSLNRYSKELSIRLKEIISSDETVNDIKNAFGCHVFLSYRKSDTKEAKRVIAFLRQNKKLKEAAIWYDDYLIPGDNYEIEIEEEIKNCDFFVLVVTKNVIEKSYNLENGKLQENYVLRVEYPLALKYQKPIIPILVGEIDDKVFLGAFQNVGDVIRCDKKYELEQKLRQLGICPKKSKASSKCQYLLGIAFLNGILTEIDTKKGIELLRHAAKVGQMDAIAKLARMYYYGEHVQKNWQYSASFYKLLINEVEKNDVIERYPYCYNNYAAASVNNTSFNKNYIELIHIFEDGIKILREHNNSDSEFLFYYAMTLVGYRNAIFSAMYDEMLDDIEVWKEKRELAFNEAIVILDELIQRDEFEEEYLGLKVKIENEMIKQKTLPEAEYMYRKENNGEEVLDNIEKLYINAIKDMKKLYELNPLDSEEEYIKMLYQASLDLLMIENREKILEWAKECLEVCESSLKESRDESFVKRIDFYKQNIIILFDYLSMDLLFFLRKYNECLLKSKETSESNEKKWLIKIGLNYLQQKNNSDEIFFEIGTMIEIIEKSKIEKEDHLVYVLLKLEYAYRKGDESIIIDPSEYMRSCSNNFYASMEERCMLGNRMTEIAIELCKQGKQYDSALKCLNSALELLTDISKRNKCYLGDLKIAFYVKDNLERMMPILIEKPNWRLLFDLEKIVTSNDDGIYICEMKE